MQTIRSDLRNVNVQKASHPGLILARYLQKQNDPATRSELQNAAKMAAGESKPFYQIAFERWKKAWKYSRSEDETKQKPFRGSMKTFEVDQQMIIGLGSDNVLEAGLTLHQTYGVPYIPGSAIKGLCSHYCDEVCGPLDPQFKKEGELHTVIFGSTHSRGFIEFHDAWIDPDSLKNCLKTDVMTPHHSEYYAGKSAPTEFDSPVPVSFLSVSGKFLFVLSCDDKDENGFVTENGKHYLRFVWKILNKALNEKGIGGKTSSGYGFLFDPVKRQEQEENEREKQKALELQAQQERDLAETQRRMEAGEYRSGDIVEGVRQGKMRDGRFLIDNGIECFLREGEKQKAVHVNVGDCVQLQIVDQRTQNTFYVKVIHDEFDAEADL